MPSLVQKSEISIGNTKVEIVMQAGFAEHGYDQSLNPHPHCHVPENALHMH